MKRITASFLAIWIATACAQSHTGGDPDAGSHPVDDAASADAGAPAMDAPMPSAPVACGLNVCLAGEICCAPRCGVCTSPGACIPEAACDMHAVVCGGSLCDRAFCCPGCEADVCPPEEVANRAECPPLDC